VEARIRVFTDLLNTELLVCKMRVCDSRFVCFNNHLMFASYAMCEECIWASRRKALGATSAWPCSYWANCFNATLRSFVRHLSRIVIRLCPYDTDNRNTGSL
jgi:hypothetical protein